MTKTTMLLVALFAVNAVAEPRCGVNTGETVKEAMKSTVRIQACAKLDMNKLKLPAGLPPEKKEELQKQLEERLPKGEDGQPMNCGSLGSGILLDDHHVITNAHVVNDGKDIAALLVTVNDGRQFKGQLAGLDTELDLAVIGFDQKFTLVNDNVKPAVFGPTDALKIGDPLFAIGQPFGLQWTTSFLNVSYKDRIALGDKKNRYLQVDGSVNPGNSGGPAFDCSGKVVGINAAIFSKSGDSAGIGFTIPTETIMALAPYLVKEAGEFQGTSLGISIGVVGANETSPQRVAIAEVEKDGLAAKMGVQAGDLFVSVKHVPVNGEPGMVDALLSEIKAGTEVQLVMERDGKELNLTGSMGLPGPM